MPRYEITAPDGKRYEITAPEGATQEQALEFAKQQFAQAPAPAPEAAAPAPAADPSFLEMMGQVLTSPQTAGGPLGMIGREGVEEIEKGFEAGGYKAGGAVTDIATRAGASPEAAAGAGLAANTAVQAIPVAIGTGVGRLADKGLKAPFKYAGEKIRNFIDPWLPGGVDRAVGRTAVEAAGPKRQAVIEALQQNRQIVPGSLPTAGEAAATAGSAEFSGLQRVTQPRRPTDYLEREAAQEGARRDVIQGIGQDERALASAVAKRAASARANYGGVAGDVVATTDDLKPLMGRPSMSKAMARAKELTAEQGAQWSDDALTAQNMQNLKMALDDMVRDPKTFGIGGSEAAAIEKTRSAFVDWLSKASPQWEAARTAYAAESVPINRMQVGQELERALRNQLGTAERPAAFASAVQGAPRTIKRATGQTRFDKLNEVLDPSQTQGVQNVLADLKRTGEFEHLARAGTEKARDLVGQVAPAMPAAGMFNPKYSVVRAITNRLAGRVEGKAVDRLAEAMLDPELMARLMQKASPSERKAIVQALVGQRALGGTLGGAAGGAYGYQSGSAP